MPRDDVGDDKRATPALVALDVREQLVEFRRDRYCKTELTTKRSIEPTKRARRSSGEQTAIFAASGSVEAAKRSTNRPRVADAASQRTKHRQCAATVNACDASPHPQSTTIASVEGSTR